MGKLITLKRVAEILGGSNTSTRLATQAHVKNNYNNYDPTSLPYDDDTRIISEINVVGNATLTVGWNNNSRGTLSGHNSGTYNIGTSITVSATPRSGDMFEGWYNAAFGGTKLSSGLSYTFTLNGDTAVYARIYWLDVEPTNLSFDATGGLLTFTITTNCPSWTIT